MMKWGQRGYAIVFAAALTALLAACGEPKTQDEVDRDVSKASTAAAQDMADARKDAIHDVTSARADAQATVEDADRKAADAQSDVLKAAADATYKLAMEQAAGDHEVALKKCEALIGDSRKSCRDRANADYTNAEARAYEGRATHTPMQG